MSTRIVFIFVVLFAASVVVFNNCSIPSSSTTTTPTAPNTTASYACGSATFLSDHYVQGSINGQNNWFVDPAASFNEKIVNIGTAACRGTGVWQISNNVVSGGFGNQPQSPVLPEQAGESSVRNVADGDTMDVTFWVQTASALADGSSVTISMSPTSADRQTYLRLVNNTDANGGFQLIVIDYQGAATNGGNYNTYSVLNQPRGQWMQIHMVANFLDGSSNDVFTVAINGQQVVKASTWEDYHTLPVAMGGPGSVTEAVDRVLFRMNALPSSVDPSFTDGGAQGFYLDDFSELIYNKATPFSIISSYQTGFEP